MKTLGILTFLWDYKWSSVNDYFSDKDSLLIDNRFVEELFDDKENLRKPLKEWLGLDLPVLKTDKSFIDKAIERFDRRKKKDLTRKMRIEDYSFKTEREVIEEFEKRYGIKIDEIDINTKTGKSLRTGLLVLLKDDAGLTYSKIIQYPLFRSLKYSSLGNLYKRWKKRQKAIKSHIVKHRP